MENVGRVNSRYIINKYSLYENVFKEYFQKFSETIKKKNEFKFRDVMMKYSKYGGTDF
jgi:hypothetical protein